MVLILHGSPISSCTARVLVSLVAMGLEPEKDFQIAIAALAELKTPEWLSHQPFAQMPWLEDTKTGVEVCESRAIVRYVAAKLKSPIAPSPDDLAAFAKYEQGAQHELTQWAGCTDKLASELVFTKLHGGQSNLDVITEQKEILKKKLEGYERILSKQSYIGGDRLTLVDLAHLPYGNIVDYVVQELLALPAWKRTKELGHKEFHHLRE